MHPNTEPAHAAHGGYEKRDVNIGLLARFVVGLLILVVAALVLMWSLFGALAERREKADTPVSPLAATLPKEPPEPRLQQTPGDALVRMHENEKAALESYGWVDKNSGVVRIPIDRAMDLVLEKGLPARKMRE